MSLKANKGVAFNGSKATGLAAGEASGDAIEFDQAHTRRGLPAWAPKTLVNPYDSRLNVYNVKASNTRGIRAGITRALEGGLMHVMCMGDSLAVGTNGSTTQEHTSLPRFAGTTIADAIGVKQAGGLSMAPGGSGTLTDRWSKTGTVGITLPYLTMSTGATVTYTSYLAGTTCDIWLSNASAACTYSIDGEAPVAITAGSGATTLRKISRTGLADGVPHTVVITATVGTVDVLGIAVTATSGVAVHNLAYGGSRTVAGGVATNWTDTGAGGLYVGRKATWDAGGITPDLFLLVVGGSDIYNGASTADAITGITTMRNWYPDVDCAMVQAWEVPTTDLGDWDDYFAAKYELADSLDIPFFDMRHRYADTVADAVTAGFTGPDNIHPDHGVSADMGLNIGHALVGGNSNDQVLRNDMAGAISTLLTLHTNIPAAVETYTNKRITKRVVSTASTATLTVASDDYDAAEVTAQAAGLTIAAPTGTPTEQQSLIIRIKDNGTARALTWNAAFRAIGVTLPTTTVISKTVVVGCMWNTTASKWDVVAVAQEA